MPKRLLRRLAAIATSFALAAGALQLVTVPAHAASFSVSLKASATKVVVGKTVTFTGKVSPKPSSRTLYLQRRYVGSTTWKNIKKFSAAKSGSFKVATGFDNDTDRYYRIYKPKQGSRKAGYSSVVQVVVDPKPKPTTVALNRITPAGGPLSGGQKVTITGAGLARTTKVTFTAKVKAAYTKDNTGILPELPGVVTVIDDTKVEVTTPASLGGSSMVKVYTPAATLTTTYTYARSSREPSDFERQVLVEINEKRSAQQTCAGKSQPAVGPLSWSGELSDVALAHSRDLAARQSVYQGLSHVTYGLDSFAERFYAAGFGAPFGEILALSPKDYTAAQVVQQWMNSAGHCTSIMNKSWTKAGVGVAPGSYSGQASIFSNVDFQ